MPKNVFFENISNFFFAQSWAGLFLSFLVNRTQREYKLWYQKWGMNGCAFSIDGWGT
jgi:hypothetical protein